MPKIYLLFFITYFSLIISLETKKDLFDATQYKNMKMKNRVFKGAVIDYESWEDGKLTEKYYKRYEELSKKEIGTIITGVILVEENKAFPVPMIDKDEYINQFKKMTDSVHKNGANIIAQISIIRDFDMTVEEIHRIINLFAETAERCKKAGFDGVEIAANHHGTLSQYLSPSEQMNMEEVRKTELDSSLKLLKKLDKESVRIISYY